MATSVTVTDPLRKLEFERVFGTSTVPVKGWLPFMAALPIGRRRVYELDIDALDRETRYRLVQHLAAKFGVDVDEAAVTLDAEGVPILADDCSVTHYAPGFGFTDRAESA